MEAVESEQQQQKQRKQRQQERALTLQLAEASDVAGDASPTAAAAKDPSPRELLDEACQSYIASLLGGANTDSNTAPAAGGESRRAHARQPSTAPETAARVISNQELEVDLIAFRAC